MRTCKLCDDDTGIVVGGEYALSQVLLDGGYTLATLMSKCGTTNVLPSCMIHVDNFDLIVTPNDVCALPQNPETSASYTYRHINCVQIAAWFF